MLKLVAVLLALCAISGGLSSGNPLRTDGDHLSKPVPISSKLYVTDDLCMVDFVDHYKLYSSNEINKAGYLGMWSSKETVGVYRANCTRTSYHPQYFTKIRSEASQLFNSSVQFMDKARNYASQKLMVVSLSDASVVVDKNNGYPQPKHINSKGLDITVLTSGHCIVKGRATDNFRALIIHKHMVFTDILDEGRGCVSDEATRSVLDEVKTIASEC